PKCAQGFSAGSSAVAYALAWYGAGSYLDNAELLSGPVFSDIQQGCEYPQPPLAGWVCNNGTTSVGNNSAAQGDIFYQQFTSTQQAGGSFSLNPVSNCNGDEGVDPGTVVLSGVTVVGSTAISNDTIAHCIVRH